MAIVARARLLPPSEADSLQTLIREIIKGLPRNLQVQPHDPLLSWFKRPTAAVIRGIEGRMRDHLFGDRTLATDGVRLDNISGLAATFYVALFSVCRQLTARYQTSNPTWIRKPVVGETRVGTGRGEGREAGPRDGHVLLLSRCAAPSLAMRGGELQRRWV